jgi:hypothetical protein
MHGFTGQTSAYKWAKLMKQNKAHIREKVYARKEAKIIKMSK